MHFENAESRVVPALHQFYLCTGMLLHYCVGWAAPLYIYLYHLYHLSCPLCSYIRASRACLLKISHCATVWSVCSLYFLECRVLRLFQASPTKPTDHCGNPPFAAVCHFWVTRGRADMSLSLAVSPLCLLSKPSNMPSMRPRIQSRKQTCRFRTLMSGMRVYFNILSELQDRNAVREVILKITHVEK